MNMDPNSLASINPFVLLGRSVDKNTSIAFTFVFAVFFVYLVVRFALRRPKFWIIYVCVITFALARLATFILRWLLAAASPTHHSYKKLLILTGVVLVMGYLFLVESLLSLLFEWFCVLRGFDDKRLRRIMIIVHHVTVLGISLLGITGAVLQIFSLDSLDLNQFNTAKHLRQTSGALFIVVNLYLIFAPLALLRIYPSVNGHRGPITAIISLGGVALILEALYRVAAATVTSGWFLTQKAVNVLLCMPELAVMLVFTLLDLDDLGNITLFTFKNKKKALESDEEYDSSQPSTPSNDKDAELEDVNPTDRV